MAKSSVESLSEVVVNLTKTPIRVLHVDDEAGFLKAAKQCLEMEGPFQVETASSVEEARERMRKKKFDVIVSDYVMPGKDGLEFLKKLREKGNNIPFIIFTGKGREEVAIEALNLGADQYLNKTGDPEAVYGELAHSIRRAVERKRAEKRLRESEEKYRNLFENARDVTLTLDLKGKVTSINKAAVGYGFKKDEVIGQSMLKFVPKKYWPKLLKELVWISRGKTVEGEIEINTPKGKKIAEYTSNPIIIEDKVVGAQTILEDITERKTAEEKIRSIFASSPDAITVIDLDGNITECNQATLDMLGYSKKEELIGKSGFALVAKKDRERVKENLKKLLEQGSMKNNEYTALTKDGREIQAELSSSVLKDSSGNPIGFVAITRDITERKRAEQEIRIKNNAIASSINAIAIADLEGNLIYVNRSFLKMWGCNNEKEVLGKSCLDFWQSKEKAAEVVKALMIRGNWTGELTATKKGGSTFYVYLSASMVKDEDGKPIRMMASFVDITERKKAEEALIRLSNAVKMSTDSIVISDLAAKIIDVNEATLKMYGTDNKGDLIGKNSFDLIVPRRPRKSVGRYEKGAERGIRQKSRVSHYHKGRQ